MKIPEANPSYALPAGIAVRADGELASRANPFAAWPARRRSSAAWLSIPLQTTFAAA
jgi:hypothetical protein